MNEINAPALTCPNCREAMQARELERQTQGSVQIDLCFPCGGLWFDHLESIQLAPSAVLELFKSINEHLRDPRQPLGRELSCPRCRGTLLLSQDLGKAGRFSYFRCPRNDGRFTPFLQFLREKQFVRNLTETEIRRLRTQIRQVSCSECGAPIDLEHDTQCRYCHAAVSFIDPDAVEKAVRMWSQAESRRREGPTPEAIGDALLRMPGGSKWGDGILLGGTSSPLSGGVTADLVSLGIRALGHLLSSL